MNTNKLKKYIITLGLVISLMVYGTMVYTFYLGFLNGGQVTIILNQYGEMNIEAFLYIPFILVYLIIALYVAIKQKIT